MTDPVRLEVENLSWGPDGRAPILSGVSFTLAPGERLAVVGPNGAGKSSLLRCLYRVNRPTAGCVRLDGADLRTLKPRDAARQVAAVLQEAPGDFPFTVREMVEAGRTPHVAGLFRGASGEAAVADAMNRMAVDSLADRRFSTLSGGEKQRALIARALAQEPGLLVLDEPTNHLDLRHRLEAMELLRGLDLTIVATLHDLDFASGVAGKVLALAHGRLAAFGPVREVLTPELIRACFDVEAEVEPWRDRLRFGFLLPEGNT
ncbi:ABC transporter [Methylopila capsulata]|uniref:ABC transporter n=1 Tax=Methylopila capsulata TaxID=61654 RepID=A0A9W6MQJ7_9HYPH|nr:ABC transporter [Methylopila capsulata]